MIKAEEIIDRKFNDIKQILKFHLFEDYIYQVYHHFQQFIAFMKFSFSNGITV